MKRETEKKLHNSSNSALSDILSGTMGGIAQGNTRSMRLEAARCANEAFAGSKRSSVLTCYLVVAVGHPLDTVRDASRRIFFLHWPADERNLAR